MALPSKYLQSFIILMNMYSSAHAAFNTCTGSNIDAFRITSNGNSAASSSITDNNGNFWVAGLAYQGSNSHWIIRKSSDGGLNWSTKDDFQYSADATSYSDTHSALGKDSNGNLYLVGYAWDATKKIHWIVRKSNDQGETWNTIDDYQFTSGQNSAAEAFGSDAKGAIYIAGYGSDTNGKHWLVRKSSDAGATWTIVDNYQLKSAGASEAVSFASDTKGNLYFAGYSNADMHHWIVRKSTDAGLTWNTVDDFNYNGLLSDATAISSDNTGNLYAVGSGLNSDNSSAWIVRKSSDQGASWNTVDAYQGTVAKNSNATSVSVDANGNIAVGGFGQDAKNVMHWTLRGSSDHGQTWDIKEIYNPGLYPKTLWADANGNIFSAGIASNHWLVRKLVCS